MGARVTAGAVNIFFLCTQGLKFITLIIFKDEAKRRGRRGLLSLELYKKVMEFDG
jgi:hypothetical protein